MGLAVFATTVELYEAVPEACGTLVEFLAAEGVETQFNMVLVPEGIIFDTLAIRGIVVGKWSDSLTVLCALVSFIG